MTAAHFARLWLAVGLVLVFYSINSWIAGQGGEPILDVNLIDERPVTSALIAIPICAALLTLLCRIGIGFAGQSPNAHFWHERMPVIGLEGLDTASREGRIYQGFFLLLLVGVPAAALAYFTDQVLGAHVFDRQNPAATLGPLDPISPGTVLSGPYWNDRFRLGESGDKAVSWFPVLEPVLLASLLAIAAWHVAELLRVLFSGQGHAPDGPVRDG